MGKLEETQEAYFGKSSADDLQEKVIVERDRMCLVQALIILHVLSRLHTPGGEIQEAFQVVFEFIDDMAILLKKSGGSHESKSNKTE